MGLWPASPELPAPLFITPISRAMHGAGLTAESAPVPVSTVLGTGNLSLYWPIILDEPATLVKAFVMNGATVNGNCDLGIYDRDLNKIVSTGSTAQAGASALQEIDITDVTLDAGVYYLAFAFSSATAAYFFSSTAFVTLNGSNYMAATFPLPATLTRSGTISGVVVCGLSQRSLVA